MIKVIKDDHGKTSHYGYKLYYFYVNIMQAFKIPFKIVDSILMVDYPGKESGKSRDGYRFDGSKGTHAYDTVHDEEKYK